MNEVRKASWLQYTMLLGSLTAGTIATQLVPAYQDHIGTVTYPSRAAASRSDASRETASGYSQTEKQGPHIAIARSSS